MCYGFDSWHWKARAKEMEAQVKTSPAERTAAPAKPVAETQRTRPEVKEPEKVPV